MAKGKIVQVIGPVVDIEFPAESLPEILNAVTIKGKYKLSLLDGKYILDDLEYNRELPQENITANSKEEFIFQLKESEFYKTEL